eukprot:scaffold5249_cov15-Prasinocladus_malaysianus.AAC.1
MAYKLFASKYTYAAPTSPETLYLNDWITPPTMITMADGVCYRVVRVPDENDDDADMEVNLDSNLEVELENLFASTPPLPT